MEKIYKIGNLQVNERGLERMYQSLDQLRRQHVYSYDYFVTLTACMEEVAKKSKRLKALAERSEE